MLRRPWAKAIRLFPLENEISVANLMIPLTIGATGVCWTARRCYVYQPPGTREPNMPWYRSSASAINNSNNNAPVNGSNANHTVTANQSSAQPPQPQRGAAPSKKTGQSSSPPLQAPIPQQPPPPQGSARTRWGTDALNAATVDPFANYSSHHHPTAAATPATSNHLRPGAADLASASPSSGAAHPSTSSSTASDAAVGYGSGTAFPFSPLVGSTAPPPPPPPLPPTPKWSGPVELRTPIEYILNGAGLPGTDSALNDGSPLQTKEEANMLLNELAALLIDPSAEKTVEAIPLRTFVSMQPKRQLLALNSRKNWWEWITSSAPYREAQRQASNTDGSHAALQHDQRLLRDAGLTLLLHWVEQQHLVNVSPRTRSVLDAAVAGTVTQHVQHVLSVLRECHTHRDLLRRWLSDVVGKFILDSLKLSVEAAAVAVQKAKGARSWGRRRQFRSLVGNESAEEEDMADYDELEAGGEADNDVASKNSGRSKSSSKKGSSTPVSGASGIRAGEVCTVEHYVLFLQKVTTSVRQERWNHRLKNSGGDAHAAAAGLGSPLLFDANGSRAGRGGFSAGAGTHPNLSTALGQEELEVQQRTKAVVASAFSQMLQHAVLRHLPQELRALADGGYLALDRVLALLQRAATQLQLRSLPVGHFIVHSTASTTPRDEASAEGTTGKASPTPFFDFSAEDLSRPVNGGSNRILPGAFLTDDEDPSVPLMRWKRPRRAREGGAALHQHNNNSSHTNTRVSLYDGESLQESYYSMLYHLQSSLEKLSFTTMEELLDDADSLSGCPHSSTGPPHPPGGHAGGSGASSSSLLSGVFGEDWLCGSARLVEDRLATAISIPPSSASVEKPPLYFLEAGPTCGKTALLERLQQRVRPSEQQEGNDTASLRGGRHPNSTNNPNPPNTTARGGAVLVRYHSATTPFTPDLDDHPVAFASRFWFRVALSTMPYFTRAELLFSRAPSSTPLWWSSHLQHWSYATLVSSGAIPASCIPTCVLVDDAHRVLDAMESKWARVLFNARGEPIPSERVKRAFDIAVQVEEEEEQAATRRRLQRTTEKRDPSSRGEGQLEDGDATRREQQEQLRRQRQYEELANLLSSSQSLLELPLQDNLSVSDGAHSPPRHGAGLLRLDAPPGGGVGDQSSRRISSTLFAASRRQQAVEELQRRTGQSIAEILSTCMAHFTSVQGEVHLVLAGQRVSPLLLAYSGGGGGAVVRQLHLPILSPGVLGWQHRLRVLPPLAVLQALHRRAGLELPGVLYEVVKNSPALIGTTIEVLWSATENSAHVAAATALAASHSSHSSSNALPMAAMDPSASSLVPLQRYDPQNLFVELPLRNRLLRHPQHARQRLVDLLQRQLCSPNGCLSTLLDTTLEDAEMGLVIPHSHTLSQVHPFAVFTIFLYQAAVEQQDEAAVTESEAAASQAEESEASEEDSSESTAAAAASSSTTVVHNGQNRKQHQIVRAWAEVWAEYQDTVLRMATTPARKKEALRVLLHGALLLRAAGLSGADMDLDCRVPPYGFPLLASDIRVRPGRQVPPSSSGGNPVESWKRQKDMHQTLEVRPATPVTVRRAVTAYKNFFAQAMQRQAHFSFRPVVGLNCGCEVVLVSGSTLYLYDIAISSYHLGKVIQARFAEALLGVLHLLSHEVLPRDKIRQVQYVTVVCCDQEEEPAYYRSGGTSVSAALASQHTATPGMLLSQRQSPAWRAGVSASVSSAAGSNSSYLLQRPDNVAAAVPHLMDYSALLDDDTMDTLQYLRREVLQMNHDPRRTSSSGDAASGEHDTGIHSFGSLEEDDGSLSHDEPFRTVQDLIDALQHRFHLPVTQRVLSTFEELEGLLSPTLLQLVPDSMLLPPFTPALVSSEDLLQEVLQQGQEVEEEGLGPSVVPGAAVGELDDESNEYFLSQRSAGPGAGGASAAEVDDLESDSLFAQEHPVGPSSTQDPFQADQEHIYESTDMLEAMMNDEFSSPAAATTARSAAAAGMGKRPLHTAASSSPPHQHPPQQSFFASGGGNALPSSSSSSPSSSVVEEDSLAWLHDVIPSAAAVEPPYSSRNLSQDPSFSTGGDPSRTAEASALPWHQQHRATPPPLTSVDGAQPFPPPPEGDDETSRLDAAEEEMMDGAAAMRDANGKPLSARRRRQLEKEYAAKARKQKTTSRQKGGAASAGLPYDDTARFFESVIAEERRRLTAGGAGSTSRRGRRNNSATSGRRPPRVKPAAPARRSATASKGSKAAVSRRKTSAGKGAGAARKAARKPPKRTKRA